MQIRVIVLLVASAAFGCVKGEKGDKGDAGEQGPQGVPGPKGDPGTMPDVSFAGRLVEAEGPPLSSTVNTGASAADATASKGQVRFAASTGTGGRLWAVGDSDVGGLLGVGRTQIAVRAKVAAITSSAVLAKLTCQATRAGDTSPTIVSPVFEIRPNEFVADQWRELSILCEFLPNDTNQMIVVDDFVTGATDLSLDYVRVTPLSTSTRLLGAKTCNLCGNVSQTFGATATVKGSTVGDPMQVTVTISGPVLVTMTATWTTAAATTFNQCMITVFKPDGTQVVMARIDGTSSTGLTFFDCSGSWVFANLAPGRYTFTAQGYVMPSTTVTWSEDRQIAVWEL